MKLNIGVTVTANLAIFLFLVQVSTITITITGVSTITTKYLEVKFDQSHILQECLALWLSQLEARPDPDSVAEVPI